MAGGEKTRAGIVLFEPSMQVVIPGEVARMTLTLQATEGVTTISGGDIVIGSSDVEFTFAYSAEWLAAMPDVATPIPEGVWPASDFLVGGANLVAGAGSSIVLGTVSVPTTGLDIGLYSLGVDTGLDGFSSIFRGIPGEPFVSEPLSGQGSFVVGVPEPATTILVIAGFLGVALGRMTRGGTRRTMSV